MRPETEPGNRLEREPTTFKGEDVFGSQDDPRTEAEILVCLGKLTNKVDNLASEVKELKDDVKELTAVKNKGLGILLACMGIGSVFGYLAQLIFGHHTEGP